ncbi:hypothetical protein N665_0122s0072 [Sinapis alba]|nr:hypothetical protein N665_0122s0072 [Sinapis alba]
MAVFMLISASFATSEMPFMVVHKKATLNRLKSGAERKDLRKLSSPLLVFFYRNPCFHFQSNLVMMTAYDVTLMDNTWDKKTFEVVNGNTSRTWERLDVRYPPVSFFRTGSSMVLLLLSLFVSPQRHLYRKAYSTPILPLDILADIPPTDPLALVYALGGFLVLKWRAWARWNERNETSDKHKTTDDDDDYHQEYDDA